MKVSSKLYKKSLFSVWYAGCVVLASCVRIGSIVSTWSAVFSLSALLVPLGGAFGGSMTSWVVALVRMVCGAHAYGVSSLHHFAYWVPGLFASLYWVHSSRLVRLLLPLTCMLLFVVHPVGGQAWPYSCYWLVPAVLFFIPKKTVGMHALASTFIAHAVGSVIWVYAKPMTPTFWYGLIPIVAVERLFFAVGMTVCYHVLATVRDTISFCNVYVRTVSRSISAEHSIF